MPIRLAGADPLAAFERLPGRAADHGPRACYEVLLTATPLLFTGHAVAIAFRAGYYNIGAEGQFLVGAIATRRWRWACRTCLPSSLCPLGFAAGAVGGLAWALLPALLAARRDRRGRDDAAAQPGGTAGRPGPAQRSVAQLDQRVHRLRPVRHRVRPAGAGAGHPRALGLRRRAADHRGHRLRDGADADRAADPRGGAVAEGGGVQRHRGGPAAVPCGARSPAPSPGWAARRR